MASVLDLVKHYQRSIEKYPNDEQKILKCIDKLYNLGVTVQHLQDTGVGRTVNALRKEPGEVGQAARALVLKWKVMVAAEESDQEGDHNDDTTNYSSHDNGRDYENNSSKSRNKHEVSDKSDRTPKTEEKYHKHTNGNYSGSKRKYQSSEEEEHDTKKSKYSKDNGYTIKSGSKSRIESDRARSESEDSQDESSQSDSNSEASESEEERVVEVIPKIEKKHHQVESHKSSSHTKHSSSSRDKHKQESSHSKKDTEKQVEHNNSSTDKRHSSDKSKEKSQSSHTHRSSREHEKSSEKKDREHRHSEKEKINKEESFSKHSDKHRSSNSSEKSKASSNSEKHKSVSSSDKHKSSSNSEKHKSSSSAHKQRSSSSSEKNKSNLSSEHHVSNSEKTLQNNTDKQSSHKSDKERHKKTYENEVSSDKHKSVERISSRDEQTKEKSKEKHNSSKDKDSHKLEKKHSSKDTESSSKHKCESSHSTGEVSSKKSKHKSSSSKHKSKSTEEKEKPPKKGEDSDDGIDCGSGASFAEALGMFVSPTKPKKKSAFSKENMQSPNSPNYDLSPANFLAPTTKLAPLPSLEILALPEISPNYRPRPPPKFLPHFNDEDAMCNAISSKNQRTKVYSGNKVIGKITSLYDMCVQVLQEHIEALEYTGGVPYEILKPVVDKATPQQLFVLEHYNPYLMEDTDHLWQKFCEKNFRNKKRQEMETWREMYIRCQEEQEIKLKSLTANIRMTQEAKKAPIKQTKMAYVDSVVKPPRNIAKKQAQHGTAFAATASPAARVASLSATSNVLKGGRAAPAPVLTSNFKPKKAPLMQKALQFMRGRKR